MSLVAEYFFHSGEATVQNKAGVREDAIEIAQAGILKDFMPEQHRKFYFEQNLFFVSSTAEDGFVWCSVLHGQQGFIQSTNAKVLTFPTNCIIPGDPLNISVGNRLGMLGLQFHTRRRNRANGVIIASSTKDFTVQIEQTTGNCPKYIQTRQIVYEPPNNNYQLNATDIATGNRLLSVTQLNIIERADTFFLATSNSTGRSTSSPMKGYSTDGNDCSHRGGPPGFVKASIVNNEQNCHVLRWADYSGNNMFMSLGNLEVNARCGVTFIDFITKDVLQLSGTAAVDFTDRSLPGAQRVVNFTVERWRHVKNALPIASSPLIELSPFLPSASDPILLKCLEVNVEDAAALIKTFKIQLPHKSTAIEPGQFVTFEFQSSDDKGNETVTTRTWTVSSSAWTHAKGYFEISVKRAGLISTYLHQHMQQGLEFPFKGFGGTFSLPSSLMESYLYSQVVLLAGGIGITPFRAMIPTFLNKGVKVLLVYSVRDVKEVAFLNEFQALAVNYPNMLQIALLVTRAPAAVMSSSHSHGDDKEDQARVHTVAIKTIHTRINSTVLLEFITPSDLISGEVYMCGPAHFMNTCNDLLDALQHPTTQRRSENFDF